MSEETYEKVRSLTCAREVWLELNRLFDGIHEDRAYDLCMQFFSYKMCQGDDIATHIGKLKNIWKDLKLELDKDENKNLLLMCRIVETLPGEYFSFASSWRLLNKTERTVDNLTDQLCSYERALASKTEPVQQEALLVKEHLKSASKPKNQNKGLKRRTGTIICHYCKRPGHIVRNCEKWIADGKPPKPGKNVNTSPESARTVSLLAIHNEVNAADSSVSAENWYVDNGATCHLTYRSDILSSFEKFTEFQSLQVADGNRVEAVGTGTVHLKALVSGNQHDVKLDNVWYVPKLNRNLFSVLAAQDKNENSVFVSTSEICNLNVNNEKVLVGVREQNGGLFRLIARTVMPSKPDEVNAISTENLLQLYHERLAHQNKRHVKSVLKRELNMDVSLDSERCEGCIFGKAHRLRFGTRARATKPGEVIHADVCGPFCYSFSKYRYFVLFKDDYSGFRFVYFMKEKSEVPEKLSWMLAECKTVGHNVTMLLSDNGGEFDNAEVRKILHENGIRQRLIMPYTPQQNGCSERENRTLVEAARAMRLAHQELPQALWAELIQTAAYILNRTAPTCVEGKSPYELWYNQKPRITHLRVVGCTAYVHVPDQRRKKMDTKAEKGILIGYEGDDGYRIFLQPGNRTVRSRDVIFDEKIITSRTVQNWDVESDQHEPDQIEGERKEEQKAEVDPISESEDKAAVVPATGNEQQVKGMQLRHSVRKPSRFDDYVMTAATMFSSSEPTSFEEAVHSDQKSEWQKAMKNEIQSLRENQTWELTDLPPEKKAIPCKWVYKVKNNPDGSIERYKARLVIKGCAQKKGIDYDQTFSPVVRNTTIRTLLSVAASERMHLMQFDVSTAFLYGDLQEEIYMEQPEGFADNSAKVCKLKRSLYGLKQAPRCWNTRFGNFLKKLGFKQSEADPCLFMLERGTNKLILALYVDDGIVAATDECELSEFAERLRSEFKIMTKPATYFLGVEIDQKSDGSIKISQAAYTRKVLDQFGMSDCRACVTPIIQSEKADVDDSNEPVRFPYRSAVGALMYLMTGTRPDIAFAVSVVSRNLENPDHSDVVKVKRILRYLKGTIDTGIVYRPQQNQNTLLCYSDADHGGDKTTGRSTTGVVCTYAEGAISWFSQRQTSVAISTTEAEVVAASEATREVVWLKRLLNDIARFDDIPVIRIDNEAAIRLAQNPEYHRRTKHIQIRHFFVREKVAEGEVGVQSVTTEHQVADALTKALLGPRLKQLMIQMGLG
jgi:transposase InsO family protein